MTELLGDRGFEIDGQPMTGRRWQCCLPALERMCRQCHHSAVWRDLGRVEKMSRFLFYYGWHSYVIFKMEP